MTGREYDDWSLAGDEQVIAAMKEMDRRKQVATSRIRHRYARHKIKWLLITGVIIFGAYVIGPHAWSYIEFQAHSFSNYMQRNGKDLR